MAEPITIRTAPGNWTVRAGGAVLGESSRALILSEPNREDVLYFPREDLAMAFLERSDKRTTSSDKGEATYYSLVTKSRTHPDAAWSYEAPKPEVAPIAGHIAFYTEVVTIEEL